MRFGLWAVGALVLGALLSHFLLQDRGYVLVNFRGYVVEMSVPALVLLLALAYALIRAAVGLWHMPRRLGTALAERRIKSASNKLTRGLIQITEGNFARAERLLTRGIKGTDAPLVNYLMAARAAQQQGSLERRNEWLKLAYEELPEAEAAVLLTQAELQFESAEYERALATLNRLSETHPDHPVAIALLAQTYDALGDRKSLRALLPKFAHAQLPAATRDELALKALTGADEASDFDLTELKALWSSLSPELRRAPKILAWHAQALTRLGAGDQAEAELRAALKRHWDSGLVRAYGEAMATDTKKQLRHAESWLDEHADDGALLYTAARLCLANELWGKARSYLESSLALEPTPAAYALYGRLLTQLGETDSAASAYRSGLGMISDTDLSLPVLAAPRLDADEWAPDKEGAAPGT